MIRPAVADDIPAIARLIRALAEYEHLSHAVTLDEGRPFHTFFAVRSASPPPPAPGTDSLRV